MLLNVPSLLLFLSCLTVVIDTLFSLLYILQSNNCFCKSLPAKKSHSSIIFYVGKPELNKLRSAKHNKIKLLATVVIENP